ncbi:MAG: hypothetical protein ABIN91_06790 [Mucilaginibacter sp.]|uniref:hypothetical protein n=1 Tax=Mucilaginibacter sp. TaxID=1882438 RepID=UPI003265384D
MKKLLLAILLLPLFTIAQQKRIDGYAGIMFGLSPESVKNAIEARGGVMEASSSAKTYYFSNLSFNEHKSTTMGFHFFDNKLYHAIMFFDHVDQDKVISTYNALIKELNVIYGEGSVISEFRAPYQPGDGKELYALQNQKASLYTTWTSHNDDGTDNVVLLNITSELSIAISYMGGTLMKQKDAAEEAQAQIKPKAKAKTTAKKH